MGVDLALVPSDVDSSPIAKMECRNLKQSCLLRYNSSGIIIIEKFFFFFWQFSQLSCLMNWR